MNQDQVVKLILREHAQVFGYALSLICDYQAAEDILQDISLAAIRKCDQINGEDHLLPWLRTAAKFRALEIRRTNRKLPQPLDNAVLAALDTSWQKQASLESSDYQRALSHCLAKLSPNVQKLLRLRYQDGMKSAQIADILGRKLQAVYTALSRARVALAKCIRFQLSAQGGAE